MFKLLATFKQLLGLAPLRTGDAAEVQLERIQMGILELEDVLFHLNSCVMMPEAPEGASSSQGSQGTTETEASRDGEQITFTGVRALAAVFRQLETHPTQSILLAGHTDTSGGFELNYQIARQRALGVRYLLEGERDLWAAVCLQRQKVEDHQQILKFFATNARLSWDTDPGAIDDAYGDKTEGALSRFIDRYNEHFAATFTAGGEVAQQPHRPTRLDPALVGSVKRNAKHLWPEPLWRAVFDLYMEELADALDLGVTELAGLRTRHLRWADDRNRLVACGESFPIDSAHKDSYRSQKNRRVEILFFEQGQAPVLNCPLAMDRAHTSAECPLWHNAHFTPVYIDPFELETVPYFLKFLYFDRVHGTFRDVPKGLTLKAFGKNGGEMRTRARYGQGTYQVQVLKSDLEQDTDKHLYFGFEAENLYLYSADKETDTVIKTVGRDAWDALSEVEKYKHHDLPEVWYSANYWTRDAGDLDDKKKPQKGGTYQAVMAREGYKPHGDAVMTSDKPLVFSLEDIVLLDTVGGTQDIQDGDGFYDASKPPNHKDNKKHRKPLAAKSRVKILCVDPEASALTLYRPKARPADDDPELKKKLQEWFKTARIPFPRNCITARVPHAKAVLFREDYFTVGRKRTQALPDWYARGDVVGARAAICKDPDHHAQWTMKYRDSEFGYTGDYEAHFLHGLHMDAEHPTSFYIYHVSINFIRDSRHADRGGPLPGADDVLRFVNEGVYNAMEHWNRKNYWIEEARADGVPGLRIRPFWLFDEKETFIVDIDDLPDPGFGEPRTPGETAAQKSARDQEAKVLRDGYRRLPGGHYEHVAGIARHACVDDARTAAFGGKARCLANVCRDDDPAHRTGGSYLRSCRDDADFPFAILNLAKSTFERYFDSTKAGFDHEEYDFEWGRFTFAHELGHATGQSDEYIKSANGLPVFEQFYDCYTMRRNTVAEMYTNGSPRLHYLWYAIRYLQRRGSVAPLSGLIGSRTYVAKFEHDGKVLTHTRNPQGMVLKPKLQEPFAFHRQYPIAADPQTQVSLGLHWVGQDEASIEFFHDDQDLEYQAVLCVRPKLWIEFVDEAGLAWNKDGKDLVMYQLHRSIQKLTGKYRLVGGSGAVKSVFINFLGGFSLTDEDQWNFHLRYRSDPGILNNGTELESAGRVIEIGHAVPANTIRDALFNRTGGSLLASLGFVKTFADAQLGEAFTLEEI